MPKNVLKRMAPSPQKLREFRSMRLLGDWIYEPNLWHVNRLSAAKAFAIGLFCAMVPLPGQMFVAAFFAVKWRANLPLSVALIFITNPLTMPAFYFTAYKLGAFLLDTEIRDVAFAINLEWLRGTLLDIWQPFLLGCLVMGSLGGATGYFLIDTLWRVRVIRQWKRRARQRADSASE